MELIKLKVKEQASKGTEARTIINSFINACVKLDTTVIEKLLNEDQYFEEKDKWSFLAFLKGQFDFAKEKGFDKTILKYGRCGMCVSGHSTYEFFGDDGNIRFAYIIEKENDKIKDIYNCNASSGWFKK
ncbi:hypothetical protein [Maribacter forsetii]|uniref:hypothetical protein n=1 Tax=Maribacter forsetii TaxID=444515 RepID=UPI00055F9EE6|nr:hypothetical protein [Maribacter forsetii]